MIIWETKRACSAVEGRGKVVSLDERLFHSEFKVTNSSSACACALLIHRMLEKRHGAVQASWSALHLKPALSSEADTGAVADWKGRLKVGVVRTLRLWPPHGSLVFAEITCLALLTSDPGNLGFLFAVKHERAVDSKGG